MRRCRPNGSVRGMYEHVRGILKHKHKLGLDKKETYLPLFKLTQLKDKILNSEIRYSTQRLDTQLNDKILNSKISYSTQ